MSALPQFHICVIQPLGYVHALGFLDPAQYLRWQFARLGAPATLAKNRLRADAINIVLGAHLGFEASLRDKYDCVFLNLEQIGAGGAPITAEHQALLQSSAVIDYDRNNVESWSIYPDDVPIVSFGHAPYLQTEAPIPLSERPIDLLFFGSINERRREWLDRIESTGREVAYFDSPVYGPERDQFIRQSKAVLNCHFYETSRFEQPRAFHALSLGTPVISERTHNTSVPNFFEESVCWLGDSLEDWFTNVFASDAWYRQMHDKLAYWRTTDPVEEWADAILYAVTYSQEFRTHRPKPADPTIRRLHIGSGKDYRMGWFNVDIQASTLPDAVIDLSQDLTLPLTLESPTHGASVLAQGGVKEIIASNVLEHVPDLPKMMTNLLDLLEVGGVALVDVPFEHARTAWQDPTHVRAFNEQSWLYYTDWFWYLGWFEHRFEMPKAQWLSEAMLPCPKEEAAFMRVWLRKVETSLKEKMTARTFRADFGPDNAYTLPSPEAMPDLPSFESTETSPITEPVITAEPAALVTENA